MKRVLRILLLSFLLSVSLCYLVSINGAGLVFSTTESGPWNYAPVWGGAGVPGSLDTAIINTGDVVSVAYNADVGNLYLDGTLYTDDYTFETLDICMVNGSFVANNSASIQHKSLDINGGTYTHQSGEISISGIDDNGYCIDNDGAMTTTSNIVISSWQDSSILADFSGTGNIWNVEYTGNQTMVLMGESAQHILGNLTIGSNANAYLSQNSWTLQVDGTFTIYGQWGHGSLSGPHNIGTLLVHDSAEYYPSQGENRISTSLTINETATFHQGTNKINVTGSVVSFYPGGHAFYDLLIWDTVLNIYENITIEHWVNYSSQLPDKPFARIGNPEMHLWNNLTFTLGTDTSSGYVWSGSSLSEFSLHGPGEFIIRGENEAYFGNIRGNQWEYSGIPTLGLQWINWVTEDNGARTNLVNETEKYILYGNCSGYSTLALNNPGCTLDLNGYMWNISYNGIDMDSETILLGPGTLSLGIGSTSSFTGALNLTRITTKGNDISLSTNTSLLVDSIEYLTDQDRSGNPPRLIMNDGAVLEFKTTTGLQANNTYLDIHGSFENMAELTGPSGWHLNVDQLNDWVVIFANISNCNNSGSQAFTFLGVNWTGNTFVDTVAPIIESSLSEGDAWDRTSAPDFLINITVSDMSFVYDIQYWIYASKGTLMASGTTDWTEFGELHQVLWNTSNISVSDWIPGDYNISISTNDSHNPVKTKVAKDRARNMVCELDDEEIGHTKQRKEVKEKPAKKISFKQSSGTDIFDIEFAANKTDTRHDVKWRTLESNFKLGFQVKLPKDQETVQFTISSEAITYLPESNYHGHFLVGATSSYFFDLEDFHLEGGFIQVSDKTFNNGKESYTVNLTHPDWGKNGGWVYIDPLAGSVNTGTLEINWTLVITPEIVSPGNNSSVKNQQWANLIVSVSNIEGLTANITFYDAFDDSAIGIGSTVGNGTLQVNWSGLEWNHADYAWYATCEIQGYNGSSPISYFSTLTTTPSSSVTSPSGGGGGSGLGGSGSGEENASSGSSNMLVLILTATFLLGLIGVWAFLEYFEEGISK